MVIPYSTILVQVFPSLAFEPLGYINFDKSMLSNDQIGFPLIDILVILLWCQQMIYSLIRLLLEVHLYRQFFGERFTDLLSGKFKNMLEKTLWLIFPRGMYSIDLIVAPYLLGLINKIRELWIDGLNDLIATVPLPSLGFCNSPISISTNPSLQMVYFENINLSDKRFVEFRNFAVILLQKYGIESLTSCSLWMMFKGLICLM